MHGAMSHVQELGVVGEDADSSDRRSLTVPALGFLVADASLRLLSANHEARTILTYSAKPARSQSLAQAFEEKIRRLLSVPGFPSSPSNAAPVIRFKSGRRVYFCRAFRLDDNVNARDPAAVLVVLERGVSESVALFQVSQQFHLRQREQVAVRFLLRGLSNKEIADRMAVSPNTVKAFLRITMARMGVSTRAGIVAKILGLVLSPPGTGSSE
jgi:DNA-binding CsgD family transcriptional regulator